MQENIVVFAGFAGADATVFTTKNNFKIVSFRLAYTIKGKNGKEDRTTWMSCKVLSEYWADLALMQVKKGTNVTVVGRLEGNKYTDKNGVEKESVEIIVNTLGVISKDYTKDRYAQEARVDFSDDIGEIPF